MDEPSVYVETSVVSYLVARPSRDLIVAGHQQLTHEWWESHRNRYRVFASALVLREAAPGDPTLSGRRVNALRGFRCLVRLYGARGYALPVLCTPEQLMGGE